MAAPPSQRKLHLWPCRPDLEPAFLNAKLPVVFKRRLGFRTKALGSMPSFFYSFFWGGQTLPPQTPPPP